MKHKSKIQDLFDKMSNEVCDFIKESEIDFREGWVPATFIKDQLVVRPISSDV